MQTTVYKHCYEDQSIEGEKTKLTYLTAEYAGLCCKGFG